MHNAVNSAQRWLSRALAVTITITGTITSGGVSEVRAQGNLEENLILAAQYSEFHNGDVMLVKQGGEVVYEDYQNGFPESEPHLLGSGTKSFACAIAAAAVEDGLLTLDERVTDTLTEWQDHAQFPYDEMTIYQLLTQTSGIPSDQGILGQAADRQKVTLLLPLTFPPGQVFQYSPANYYAFAILMNRKLAAADSGDGDVIAYLQRRILDPLDITTFDVRRDSFNLPNLAAGALLTASDWAKYGELLLKHGEWQNEQLLPAELINKCFIGTRQNPYYGMSIWVQYDLAAWIPLEIMAQKIPAPDQVIDGVTLGETAPTVLVMAGEGKQRLYIIPSLDLVVVRLGRNDSGWSDANFLSILLG